MISLRTVKAISLCYLIWQKKGAKSFCKWGSENESRNTILLYIKWHQWWMSANLDGVHTNLMFVIYISCRYEYHWADGTNIKKPIKCSAPKYIDYLMTWVQDQLDDETLFPSKIGMLCCVLFSLSCQSLVSVSLFTYPIIRYLTNPSRWTLWTRIFSGSQCRRPLKRTVYQFSTSQLAEACAV